MSTVPKASSRLTRLDRILSQSPAPVGSYTSADADPGHVHLSSVPLERIQGLATELQERSAADADEIDAITMRLLLNDYKAAVAHLRAVANGVDARLDAASKQIHEHGKAIRREQEMAQKRAGRVDGDDAG